jgi:hypothetical protein
MRKCRDRLLPDLNRLRQTQDEAMRLLGIEREDLELDVLAVDTFEQRQEKKLKEAFEKGEVIDLCDSDYEDDRKPAASLRVPLVTTVRKIKD